MSPDELAERLPDFAVRVGKVANALPAKRNGRNAPLTSLPLVNPRSSILDLQLSIFNLQ